jgi:hypothetical protein
MFGLITNESTAKSATSALNSMAAAARKAATINLKGASDPNDPNNNICNKKEHLKDLLKQFGLT